MIDLRSDTVTRPTEEMWAAMREHALPDLRDDTLEGDPTVRELERLAAELTRKDDALFMASGTMGNVVATLTHGRGGGEVLVDARAHIACSEGGGIARLAGLTCVGLPGERGEMALDALQEAVHAGYSSHDLPTAMVCVETSHNHSGGYVPRLDHMRAVAALARKAGVPLHVDGARVFNAAIALGVEVRSIAEHCDSLSFCLSKGLSAPMGGLLVGSRDFIARARVFRRMVGGGFRQSGIMAAAGIVALRTMPARLADDHRRTRDLWDKLRGLNIRLVDADPPQTNILQINVGTTKCAAAVWVERLERQGVLVRAASRKALRLVTHRHVDDAAVEEAFTKIAAVAAECV